MRGPDIVIEASGNPAAVKLALELVRDAGTVIIVGQYTDNGDIGINPHLDINKKHIRVQGCWGSDYSHFHRGVQAVRDLCDRFNWRTTVSATYRLADTQQALDDVASRKVVKAVIAPAG
jgi:L-iditol 2-dehydrogenase